MNRHQFRWDAFVFGLFFLAVLGQWAVWEMDWFEPDNLAYLAAAVLIVLGLVGIAGTTITARSDRGTAPFTPTRSTEPEPIETQPTDDEPSDVEATQEGKPA